MKNILLTGATRGLGLAICANLLNAGYCVYATARSRSDEFSALEVEFGDYLHFVSADLSSSDEARRAVFSPQFVSNSVALCGFVDNAACAYSDLISNIDSSKLRAMFEVNVFSPMVFTKYAVRNMIFNRIGGSIVHITSVSARTGYKGLAMYAATKGAIEAFSKNVAREWGSKKIRSNCVSAGFMETGMSASLTVEQRKKIFARSALGLPTSTESVAETVSFLLSDKSVSITGQSVPVDSGAL